MNPADGLPVPQRYVAAAAIMLGILMASLDSAIVNLALPTLARELNVEPAAAIWIANGYQLASAASMLAFAALGPLLGQRQVFNAGLLAFTLTSLGCALTGSFEWLVGLRVLQGLAYAAMVSIGLSLYRSIFPAAALGTVLGFNALIVSVGTAAGPALGGLIITWLPWQWLFLVNLPFGALAVLAAWRAIPDEGRREGGFDYPGAGWSALGMGALVLGVDRLSSTSGLLLVGVAVGCLLAFIRRQQRAPWPLLPLDIFAARRFNLAICASVCVFVAQGLALVALPFLLQQGLGYSVLDSALLLTAWPLAVVACAPLAGRLCARVRPGLLASVGLGLYVAGLGALAGLPQGADAWDTLWRVALCGAGYGVFLPPNNQELLGHVARNRTATASGILSTARTLGQAMGAALVALVMVAWVPTDDPGRFVSVVYGVACAVALVGLGFSLRRIGSQC